jgi:hypothetical protein
MVAVRKRVWGTLNTFLTDVASGAMVSALEEAQTAARGDPRKERVRLKRQEERLALQGLKDMEAYGRLSQAGLQIRADASAKRRAAKVKKAALSKAEAIKLVGLLHDLMWSHPEGHTLMVGMPSRTLLEAILALPGANAKMESYVSAEVRRFQRAVGMSMWEVVMAHNRCVDPKAAGPDERGNGQGPDEPADPGTPPGGAGGRVRVLRQAKITSWKLLPDDAVILMDAIEYEQDVAAAESARLDFELLKSHPANGCWRSGAAVAGTVVSIRKSAAASHQSALDKAGLAAGRKRKLVKTAAVAHVVVAPPTGGRRHKPKGDGWVAGVAKCSVAPASEEFGVPSRFDVLAVPDSLPEAGLGAAGQRPEVAGLPQTGGHDLRVSLPRLVKKVAVVRSRKFGLKGRWKGSPLQGVQIGPTVDRSPDPITPWAYVKGRFQFELPVVPSTWTRPLIRKFRKLVPSVGPALTMDVVHADAPGTEAAVAHCEVLSLGVFQANGEVAPGAPAEHGALELGHDEVSLAAARSAWLSEFVGRLEIALDKPGLGDALVVSSSLGVRGGGDRLPKSKKRSATVELTVTKGRAAKKTVASVVDDLIFRDLVPLRPEECGPVALVDLTGELTLWPRCRRGRWSAVLDPTGGATLSRVVDESELARNTGRIPAYGLCGYLALQRAAEGAGHVEAWSDLRIEANRERLGRFLSRLLVGCTDDRVRRKLELVQISLRYSSHPWRLGRDSGGWLDIGDLAHLLIDFPLVVWGSDMGDGHRRIRYPVAGNGPLNSTGAGLLSRSEGQLILDSDHFFPLDNVAGEGAEVVVAAVCGESRARRVGLGRRGVGGGVAPGLRSGACGLLEPGVGERGDAEAAAERRKRSADCLPVDVGEQEADRGCRDAKEARTELEPEAAVRTFREDVWGCDMPD